MKKFYLPATILIIGLTLFAAWDRRAPEETFLESQTSSDGPVTVTITPRLGEAGWNFAVVLDSHSEELNVDLTQAVTLLANDGKEHPPLSWEGDSPGGHHRSGLLKFSPPSPSPAEIILIIRDVGGESERKFVWPL